MTSSNAQRQRRLSLQELRSFLIDDERCFQLFARWRFPNGFVCPACGSVSAFPLRTRRLWQCRRCSKQVSVTSGTALHRTRLPLRHWLYATWMVANRKQSISALQLQKELGLSSYDTAWCLLHKIRRALRVEGERKLEGLVVLGIRPLGRHSVRNGGRYVPGRNDIGIVVERGRKRCEARFRLHTRSEQIEPSLLAACNNPRRPTIERRFGEEPKILVTLFQNFEAWLQGTFHSVTRHHLPSYVDEFAFRFNRRDSEPTIADEVADLLLRRATAATRTMLREGQPLLT